MLKLRAEICRQRCHGLVLSVCIAKRLASYLYVIADLRERSLLNRRNLVHV